MSPSVIRLRFPIRVAIAAALASVLSLLPARADEALDQYAVAAGHYAQRRWKFAAEQFQTFVQEHPDHAKRNQALFFLAETLVQLGRLDEAATHFRSYVDEEPKGGFARPALFRAGEAAYLGGHFDLAKDELERFLAAYPDDELNAFVLPYLGDVALSQDDPATAESHFRRGLTDFAQGQMQDECRFGLARALEKQGQTEEAARFYMAVAAKTGSRLVDDAQFCLGAMQYTLGRHEDATRSFLPFESSLAESPWQSTARLGRGWALVKLGRLAEAKSVFEGIRSEPSVGVEARYWLGLTEKAQKDWRAAAQTLLETAKDHPNHKLAGALRFHAADALFRAGDTGAAAELFDQVIASASDDTSWVDDALRGRVQVALQTKDDATLDRRAAEFTERFAENPLAPDVQRMLAQSLVRRKEHERAVEVLEPLVAAGDDREQALSDRYLLALAYEGLERHQDALDALVPVVKSADGQLRSEAQLAQVSALMKLKRFDEAIAALETVLAPEPSGEQAVNALGNLAICYAEIEQLQKAKDLYARLLDTHPGHPLISPATEQLAEAAYDAGDVAWSRQLFAWLVDHGHTPQDRHRGLSGLSWSQYKDGHLELAAATFDSLLKNDPDPPLAAEAALARGQILEELGRLDAALVMYDRVIDQWPTTEQFPKALWRAALLRDTLQQDREAAALYQRLANLQPQFADVDAVLYNWAWALADLGRDQDSAALFERIRKEHPASSYWADATFRLAQRAFESKDYDRSGEVLADLLAAEPNAQIEQNALYLQGQIAAARQQWDEARRSFEALLQNHTESPLRLVAEYAAAEAVFRSHDYESAIERLTRLVRQTQGRDEPWMAVIRLRLGQSLCHRKQWDEAYEIASQIEAEYPDFEEQYEADYVIGRCLSARAEFERARQAYHKVIRSPEGKKTETAAKAQLMIAESYYHQKDYQMALGEYLALEILYDHPGWQAAAVFQAAKCHEMLGEWKQAVDQYERLLQAYPNATFAEGAAERLQVARQRLAAGPAT